MTPKVENYFEELFPIIDDKQLHRWFRINRETFHEFADILTMDENLFPLRGKPIKFKKHLAMTLTYLGTQLPPYQ